MGIKNSFVKKGTRKMKYTTQQIKNWDVSSSVDGKTWIPARPELFWSFKRIKYAWLVLIGKLDVLDWK